MYSEAVVHAEKVILLQNLVRLETKACGKATN
jgi:hypothetical protein